MTSSSFYVIVRKIGQTIKLVFKNVHINVHKQSQPNFFFAFVFRGNDESCIEKEDGLLNSSPFNNYGYMTYKDYTLYLQITYLQMKNWQNILK